jgi:hypothetical protein
MPRKKYKSLMALQGDTVPLEFGGGVRVVFDIDETPSEQRLRIQVDATPFVALVTDPVEDPGVPCNVVVYHEDCLNCAVVAGGVVLPGICGLTDVLDRLRDDLFGPVEEDDARRPGSHTDGSNPFREEQHEELIEGLCEWAIGENFIDRYDLQYYGRFGCLGSFQMQLHPRDPHVYRPGSRNVVVSSRISSEDRLRVTYHELAHAIGLHGPEEGAALQEVGAETVAHVVMARLGYDTSAFSDAYIADYMDEVKQAADSRRVPVRKPWEDPSFKRKLSGIARRLHMATGDLSRAPARA